MLLCDTQGHPDVHGQHGTGKAAAQRAEGPAEDGGGAKT